MVDGKRVLVFTIFSSENKPTLSFAGFIRSRMRGYPSHALNKNHWVEGKAFYKFSPVRSEDHPIQFG